MVSTHSPTSKSSSPFSNPLFTVPNAPITIGIIVTCMFIVFFSISLQGRGNYPSFPFLSVLFCGQPGQQSRQFCKFSLFFFCWLLLGQSFWTRLGDPCVCQNPIEVYVCYFLRQVLGCEFATLRIFLYQHSLMVFPWSLSYSKNLQVFWTLLSILAVPKSAVVWMCSTRVLISSFSSPLPILWRLCRVNRLQLVSPSSSNFFQFSWKVQVLISLFAFLQFYPVVCRNGKAHN